jgi:lipid-A-disaccharide synthase
MRSDQLGLDRSLPPATHLDAQTGSVKTRVFISTGEVSGDLQGALLVAALHRQAAQIGLDLEILGLGGDRMTEAGAMLLGNTSAIGSIGILESLPFVLPTIQIQQRVKQYLRREPPDLVVMIDYLGPNLGMGNYMRRHLPDVPTVYYITPQDWVWSVTQRNTKRIIQISDRILAIFPGEARYYQERGAAAVWVGHPLVDRVQTFPNREQARTALGIPSDQIAIALLPASRYQELRYLLPVICETAQRLQVKLPQAHFWIPLSLAALRPQLEAAIQQYGLRATVVADQPQVAIAAADLAIAKSGTVNLELALINIPQLVLYRVNPVTAWIARKLLNFSIPFMSPPNLMLMEAIVPEFLQEQATPENLTACALELLQPARRQQMLADYERMRQASGEVGVCDRAAQEILNLLQPAALNRRS